MTEIEDLQRRIAVALDRNGRGVDRLSTTGATDGAKAQLNAATSELSRLKAALEEEKTVNAQLTERLKAVKGRDGATTQALETRIEGMTRQLDVQGLEMQRLRKSTAQLRDQLRAMTEAAVDGGTDVSMINRAMATELEALRALRSAESTEVEEILSELTPLIREAAANA